MKIETTEILECIKRENLHNVSRAEMALTELAAIRKLEASLAELTAVIERYRTAIRKCENNAPCAFCDADDTTCFGNECPTAAEIISKIEAPE